MIRVCLTVLLLVCPEVPNFIWPQLFVCVEWFHQAKAWRLSVEETHPHLRVRLHQQTEMLEQMNKSGVRISNLAPRSNEIRVSRKLKATHEKLCVTPKVPQVFMAVQGV